MTEEAVPIEHRFVVGFVGVGVPFAVPQEPEMTFVNALQVVFVPPFTPLQLHDHGPVAAPSTAVAVPAEQRLVVGAVEKVLRLEEPQVPFMAAALVVNIPSAEYPVPVVFVA